MEPEQDQHPEQPHGVLDPEIEGLHKAYDALRPLSLEGIRRSMQWLHDRLILSEQQRREGPS